MKKFGGKEGFAVWITGLPASGKSTLANYLKELLTSKGFSVEILETDEVRKILTPKPTYSDEEREVFYRSLAYIGGLLVKNGINVILDATANLKKYRNFGREYIKDLIIVYLKCPLELCMKRDPKGIYRRAVRGEFKTVPGLQTPFEEPEDADVVIEVAEITAKEGAVLVLNKIKERLKGKAKNERPRYS